MNFFGVEVEMPYTFIEALAESGTSVLMRELFPTDSQTLKEENIMKVKSEYRTELRGIINTIIIEDIGVEEFLAELLKTLSVEQLADFVGDAYYELFEQYLIHDDGSNTEYTERVELLKKIPSIREQLDEAWRVEGLADFGILCMTFPDAEDLQNGETLQTRFSFFAEDMEILCDELELKMKRFSERAENILGFPVDYDFHGFGKGSHLGEVSRVTGAFNRRSL